MLSSEKRKLYLERLHQLERLGSSMPFEYSLLNVQSHEILVEQCSESPLFDLHDGRTLYFVWLSLIAEKAGVCVYDFRFVPPWPDNSFQQLPAFSDSSRGGAYVLPNDWDLPREDVLNFRFGKTGWRLSTRRVEGVLCGLSETPIPAEYSHGTEIEIGVKFFGRSGRQLAETTVQSWADRWDERAVKHPAIERPVALTREVRPSATAQPFSSGFYEGGEIDSRAQHGLRAKEPKGVDPWRQLPGVAERGTGTPKGKDRR